MVMTIPVLPCASIPPTLDFYRALGFEVTHQQERPNPYAATRRGDVHLHFMGIPGLRAEASYSTCLVIVPEVESLHAELAERLRQLYGKVPTAGVPRITRMKPGQSRFTVVDLAGNSVIYIRERAAEEHDEAEQAQTRLGKALRAAARLRDFKNDDAAAGKLLDAALKKPDGAPLERARVMAARAEIAAAQGDAERARKAMEAIAQLPLEEGERRSLQPELAAIRALLDEA